MVKARDAANHPTELKTVLHSKRYLDQNVNSAEIDVDQWFSEWGPQQPQHHLGAC